MAGLPAPLANLLQPSAYPHPVGTIQLIETHISWVLLTGEFAYKLKRPVAYDFLDLRSCERRAFYCAEELRLNRRFAPDLYLEVCDVRDDGGGAHIGGSGECIERCVKMRQFPRSQELDQLLAAGSVEPSALERFGADLADIHAGLPVAAAAEPWGWPEFVHRAVLENIAQYERAARAAGYPDRSDLRPAFATHLAALVGPLDQRRSTGRVRECHGDLHLRNIVQRDARLMAFDCMEFEPAFRWTDVAEELGLLLADLSAHGHARHAHAFLSGYLTRSGDFNACRVLNLYQAHRALVRAKIAALESARSDAPCAQRARSEHDALLEHVHRSLETGRPTLILMAGLSGSGKTWLARQLAPERNAIHLRSDVERKRLAGLEEHAHSGSRIARGLYEHRRMREVYEHLARCTEEVLVGGYSAIVDATFLKRADRSLFRDLAQRLSIALQIVTCEAPSAVLRERIIQRQQAGQDASEADLAVLEWQLEHQEPIEASEGLEVVKVSSGAADPLDAALRNVPAIPAH